MSCGKDAEKCKGKANSHGAPEATATWAAARKGGGHCDKCGGFLTREGVCRNPKCGQDVASAARQVSGSGIRSYLESEIDAVDERWLAQFKESPGFSRRDGRAILDAIRREAIERLAARRYESAEVLNRAVAAINANTLRHTAQVMVMATKISHLIGADDTTSRQAGLAAGFHDSGKDDTNFVYHHLDSAKFAERALVQAGLSRDKEEIRAVSQAIMEHMPFGDGGDPDNFMNLALVGEAASIVKTSGSEAERRRRLRYLMRDALQKGDKEIARVEAWVEAAADGYATKDELAAALKREFGGRELSYPAPNSETSRIVHTAAVSSGEHLLERMRGGGGESVLQAGYSSSDITWAADGLTLSSAESLGKIVNIHQKQWGRAGTEPIVVSMSSLAGGAFGNGGTAVSAANAMTIPVVRETAHQEIAMMRAYMRRWQRLTYRNWEQGGERTAEEKRGRRAALASDPFTAFTADEMLAYQPSLDIFHQDYRAFVDRNQDKRGVLHRV